MIPCLRVKDGVEFSVISPAGFHILWALRQTALTCGHDLTITSACDGLHSGPDDPHPTGDAYDVRSKNLPDKQLVLDTVMGLLGTTKFYGFLEDQDTENEHFHIQRRHGILYP